MTKRILKNILRAISAKSAKITNEEIIIKEIGIYNIECRMVELSNNTVSYDVWVIKKDDYSDDRAMNILLAVDGKSAMDKDEANMFYLGMYEKYLKMTSVN